MMPLKRILAALLAVFVAAGLTACSDGETSGETVTVWFLTPLTGDLSLAPLTGVEMKINRNADPVTAAINALVNGAEGYESPYRPGVRVNGIVYSDDGVTVDFNDEYLKMTGAELAGAESCAILTLCGIEGISSVSFTVEGEPYMSGPDVMLQADDIVTGDLSLKPVEREVAVYFSDGNTQYVVSETRNVVLRENALLARYIIDELIEGPNDDSLISTIPEGVELRSISSEGQVCYVNFSEEFREVMRFPLDRRIQTLTAITDSLCGVDGIECVQYYVEGEKMFDTPMYANPVAAGKFDDNSIDCEVFLPSDDLSDAVGVTMRIATANGFDISRLLCERLATGIDGNGFMSALPRGTRVNGVSLENGVAVIDFSKEFTNEPQGGVPRELMERTIALTLGATNEGIRSVTFLVEGSPYDGGRLIPAG